MFLQELEAELRQVLDNAQLEKIVLPETGQLALYLVDSNYPIHELDADSAQKVMDNPLYWMFCWASGKVMAQYIYQNQDVVRGKVVMDVGSGSGVVAIAAAKAGAKKVIASDLDPFSHKAITLNASINQVDIDIVGDYREYQGHVDIITIADVLYDRDNLPLIEKLLDRAEEIFLADSRVRNFSHPRLRHMAQFPGETWPVLGGFDEFNQVNLYEKKHD